LRMKVQSGGEKLRAVDFIACGALLCAGKEGRERLRRTEVTTLWKKRSLKGIPRRKACSKGSRHTSH